MGQQKKEAAGMFSPVVETALLVCVRLPGMSSTELDYMKEELSNLIDTMGLKVLEVVTATLKKPTPRYFVGSGKAQEIADYAKELEADCIVFDDDLSPSQQRNWEELSGVCVIDRHEVILDIFANRATTKEATLQVGLARMEYSLPRLTRAWTHLSRQRGGTKGTRGEGETQLEVDRRIVLRKISKFKAELKKVRSNRATLRKQRTSIPIPTASIVGYTNAGKSSLLNALTGADVFIEDKLFATLDPTTRRVKLKGGNEILLTDTVGFIRKLPHDLVDAFKSTLDETRYANFLIHVLDASSTEVEKHYETTLQVLEELGVKDKTIITVFNKTDLCKDNLNINQIHQKHPDGVFMSVKNKEGFDNLIKIIEQVLYNEIELNKFSLPSNRHDLAALIHRTGKVYEEEYSDDSILISASVPEKTQAKLREYII